MNETIGTWFEENQKAVINLTYDLWSHPELAYHEYHACQRHFMTMKPNPIQSLPHGAKAAADR